MKRNINRIIKSDRLHKIAEYKRSKSVCSNKRQSIGNILAGKDKSDKISYYIIIFVLVLSLLVKSYTDVRKSPANAQSGTGTQVILSEYIQNVSVSSYYAWRGIVTITGTIAQTNLQSTSLVGYIDNSLTPLFSVPKSEMALSAGTYSFNAVFNSSDYQKGFHTIRIYDRQVTSIPSLQKQPLWEFEVYIENEIRGRTLANSNLRSEPDHTKSNVITLIPQGAEVIILGEVKGVSGTVTIDGKQITTDI